MGFDLFYPVQLIADWLTYSIFSLPEATLLANAVHFFIYESIKILILLTVIIFVISIVRSYFPPERAKKILSHQRTYIGNVLAALLGIVTPFCSCSAIPLFLGFLEVGIPLGVTFSFLIASPMINEVAIVLLLGMFGWKITVIYIASGLVISIVSGIIIGKLKLEHLLEPWTTKPNVHHGDFKLHFRNRLTYAKHYTITILKKVWLYVLIGIGIGAWVHGYVPTELLAGIAGKGKWYAVPLATLIGVPLYSSAAGLIPLVGVLTEKGVALGTALAFMMAVIGLSLPEFIILKRAMKPKLIIIFAGIVTIGIIFTGYLFNFILH